MSLNCGGKPGEKLACIFAQWFILHCYNYQTLVYWVSLKHLLFFGLLPPGLHQSICPLTITFLDYNVAR